MLTHILLIVSILSLIAGIFSLCFLKLPTPNRYFFTGYIFSVGIWALGLFISLGLKADVVYTYGGFEYLITQILFVAAANVFVMSYLFIASYHKENFRLDKKLKGSLFLLLLFSFFMIFTDQVIESFKVHEAGFIEPALGKAAGLLTLLILYCYGLSIFTLYKRIKSESRSIIRGQLKMMFYGYVFFITGMIITNWFLPVYFENPKLNNTGPLFFIFEALFFIYAVNQYRFLDIRLALMQSLKVLLSFALAVFSVFYASLFLINSGLFDWPIWQVVVLGSAVSVLFYFFWRKVLESSFFYPTFGTQCARVCEQSMGDFRNERFVYNSIEEFERALQKLFVDGMGLEKARLVSLDGRNMKKYESLIPYLKKDGVLVTEEVPYLELRQGREFGISENLLKEGAVFLPLRGPVAGIVGLLVLGKKAREIYLGREISALKNFSYYLSLTFVSLLYNKDLQREVKQKTKQLKKKNIELEDSYAELERLGKAKDVFLSIASHELRTPMTVIKGYSDFLLSGDFGKLTKDQNEFVSYIYESTEDLISLVNNILDVSRIESGKMEFFPESVETRPFFKKILEGFGRSVAARNIKFTFDISSDLPDSFMIDPSVIKLIFTNLIGNAFKFTDEGGSVSVFVKEKKGDLYLEVKDTGVGISESYLERLFERFSQEENYLQHNQKGTGLGLYIVHRVVDQLGGAIKVESKEGVGTQFLINLPYIKI